MSTVHHFPEDFSPSRNAEAGVVFPGVRAKLHLVQNLPSRP